MADAKQILVVDDHFEMLEMLRSMLELSEQDYEVLAVPSAEEGLLELLRTQFDLLITDVRLPGMSGFDLVRRVRQQRPNMPVIMLTAYTSQQGQKEADGLGVYRYFAKPLDTDEMLTAVHHALFGEPAAPVPSPDPVPSLDFNMPSQARKRLETLHADTGAAGLFLATVAGQILFRIDAQLDLALEEIATTLAQNVQNSFLLAGQLEEEQPFTIQYHVGRGVSLYHANVGKDYFVTLVFRSEAQRGRIGTIWVFTQRAIHELREMLRPLTELNREQRNASTSTVPPADETEIAAPIPPPRDKPKVTTQNPPVAEESPPKPFPIPEAVTSDSDAKGNINDLLSALKLDETAVSGDVESFWNQALTDADQSESEDTLSWEEATELIVELRQNQSEPEQEGEGPPAKEAAANLSDLLSALNLDETDIDSDDVEAFWDEALGGGDSGPGTGGLSLEEAKEQGLVSLEKEDEE